MRLSVKLSLATGLGIFGGLIIPGYERVQREATLFRDDVRRDHPTMGKMVAFLAELAAERNDPERALQVVEDANAWQSQLPIRWVPDARAPRRAPPTTLESQGEDGPQLLTRVPCRIGRAGYLELEESLGSAQRYVRGTLVRSLLVTLLLVALSGGIIIGLGYWLARRFSTLNAPFPILSARAER